MYIAHRRDNDGTEQPLTEHLHQTAELAKKFAHPFGADEHAYRAGLLHDGGKYSDAFQRRIRGGPKCDHSTAGAREADKLGPMGRLLAYCIAGHHSGLLNAGSASDTGAEATLTARLKKSDLPAYNALFDEMETEAFAPLPKIAVKPLGKFGFSLSFYIRMLYSCLVDADFLDTERFMQDGKVNRIANYDFPAFLDKLNAKMAKFTADTPINQKRTEILESCRQSALQDRGLFTLTVPTGGGKTLASLAFALNHVLKHKMDRIIYVIPYTSIIEQNAKVFEELLGAENVLQHHSNFDFKDEEHDIKNKLKLSSENWDIPIVVTTNVQFFESLFANKSSRCRKLHNMANSVIILDEAQMLPVDYLTPCVMALSELTRNYNSTIVLCSATQPALDGIMPKQVIPSEICKDSEALYQFFRRTRIVKRGELDTAALAEELRAKEQALCIVNTRKHALKLFEALGGSDVFHLSTLMCPEHRNDIITEIRARLKNGIPCRVVSTRLIEAGVDVDFPTVYRSVCGLDSIIQSAGRCNREGKLKDAEGNPLFGEVHVFEPEDEYVKRQPAAFKRPIFIAQGIMRRHEDILSPQAIQEYFHELYELAGDGIDSKDIYRRLEDGAQGLLFDFEDIANDFKLIENDTRSIIIPYNDEAKRFIHQLYHAEQVGGLLRSLQKYTVNVYEPEFQGLFSAGKLDMPKMDIYVLKEDDEMYSKHTGLKIIRESGNGIYI